MTGEEKRASPQLTDRDLHQLALVADYIKFHIGLYLATPPVVVLIAEGLDVTHRRATIWGLTLMILAFAVSGVSAGRFMGRYVNERWTDNGLETLFAEAFSRRRRFLHHSLYWLGLMVGMGGVLIAHVTRFFP